MILSISLSRRGLGSLVYPVSNLLLLGGAVILSEGGGTRCNSLYFFSSFPRALSALVIVAMDGSIRVTDYWLLTATHAACDNFGFADSLFSRICLESLSPERHFHSNRMQHLLSKVQLASMEAHVMIPVSQIHFLHSRFTILPSLCSRHCRNERVNTSY